MKIESALSSAKLWREYVTAYAAAINSEILDDRNFADLAAQKRFFSRKNEEAKNQLRDSLFAGRGILAAELRNAKGVDKSEIETAIAGIDSELARL